jgi:hypothetical protein
MDYNTIKTYKLTSMFQEDINKYNNVTNDQCLGAAIVTLCGSTKFKKSFDLMNFILTLNGVMVLQPGCYAHADNIIITAEEKEKLDILHFKKIDISNVIIIINENNYIGESTQKEINYTIQNNKIIYYMFKQNIIEENDTNYGLNPYIFDY